MKVYSCGVNAEVYSRNNQAISKMGRVFHKYQGPVAARYGALAAVVPVKRRGEAVIHAILRKRRRNQNRVLERFNGRLDPRNVYRQQKRIG